MCIMSHAGGSALLFNCFDVYGEFRVPGGVAGAQQRVSVPQIMPNPEPMGTMQHGPKGGYQQQGTSASQAAGPWHARRSCVSSHATKTGSKPRPKPMPKPKANKGHVYLVCIRNIMGKGFSTEKVYFTLGIVFSVLLLLCFGSQRDVPVDVQVIWACNFLFRAL